MSSSETFSSRLALILAGVGMAVGTGNIWRFPRVAGRHGGLAFILIWLLALFVWSIPLMMAEMAAGRRTRKGPVGAFTSLGGPRWTWMGAWVVLVTLAIMAYYAVVTGWCLRYLTYFAAGTFSSPLVDSAQVWESFRASGAQVVLFHLLAVGAAAAIVVRGIRDGLERANSVLLPALFALLGLLVLRALTLPGAWAGVRHLFRFDPADLLSSTTWIEAFTQSAWSTGAGWGLLLSLAVYARDDDSSPAADCTIIGLSNNAASLLAALVILPTLFALLPPNRAAAVLGEGNTGLTFIALAALFGEMTLGRLVGVAFFTALFVAALTSLISMVELGVRFLGDLGWDRRPAVVTVAAGAALAGIPSALWPAFLDNQDWVWGLALLVSGLFIAVLMRCHGTDMTDAIFPATAGLDRRLWTFAMAWGIPLLFVVMLGWWVAAGSSWEPGVPWTTLLARYTPGTVLAQWLAGFALVVAVSGPLARRLGKGSPPEA